MRNRDDFSIVYRPSAIAVTIGVAIWVFGVAIGYGLGGL